AECEREGNVATRIYDLASCEGDVVPRVGGEKRIGLRYADSDEEPECGRGGQSFADFLQTATQRPEVAEVCRTRARLHPDNNTEHNKCDERTRLRRREDVLHELTEIQSARVHICEQRDHRQADELCGGKRERIAAESNGFDQIVLLRNPGEEHTGVARKSDSDCRDCAGLNNEKERPAVEKTPER